MVCLLTVIAIMLMFSNLFESEVCVNVDEFLNQHAGYLMNDIQFFQQWLKENEQECKLD